MFLATIASVSYHMAVTVLRRYLIISGMMSANNIIAEEQKALTGPVLLMLNVCVSCIETV